MDQVQLRPPPDPDNFRVQSGRFGDRFYIDPLPDDEMFGPDDEDNIYPSVSTLKKAVGQDWTKAATKGLAKRPEELARIAALDDEDERKYALNTAVDLRLDKASGRGTIVHQHMEAMLANRVPLYEMNPIVKPYIVQADLFLAAYQPREVASEFVAIHRTLNAEHKDRAGFAGYGGTGDSVIEIDGKLYFVDWKSRAEDSPHKAYSEEAGQVSAYGRADYWIVADPESPTGCKRIKPLDLEGGLIVSIKPDSYEVFPIDLDLGFDYFTDLHRWWQARRNERKPVRRKWAPRAVPEATASQLVEAEPAPQPTPESNRAIFDEFSPAKKERARAYFAKVNPNDPAKAGQVYKVLCDIRDAPDLRQMQETAAEVRAEHDVNDRPTAMDAEGGPAPEEMVNEARLAFEMVLGHAGKTWTALRVNEAREYDVAFNIGHLQSIRRAHIYLALTRWAAWRLSISVDQLTEDEAVGNVEFKSLLFDVDNCEDAVVPLGARIGGLSVEEAERFATLITEVVQSETGDEPVTESQDN